ncbi:putative transcriptional regulator [Mycetocola miduiensis]|uniref:Putative transcriptional regulator n=1 Tax=Mycetocola miduiensis TaxID=995034 RepID=A0A1I5ABD4_9MICO|nr:putative transcriptional regulator [Mycetocola miduiensis]
MTIFTPSIAVTRQTVIAIEQGRYSPSLETAFQIARVFQVPIDDVFRYDAPAAEN